MEQDLEQVRMDGLSGPRLSSISLLAGTSLEFQSSALG